MAGLGPAQVTEASSVCTHVALIVTVTSPQGQSAISPYTGVSQFLPTSQKIIQFSEAKEPKPTDKIVYIAGARPAVAPRRTHALQALSISSTSDTSTFWRRPRRSATFSLWAFTPTRCRVATCRSPHAPQIVNSYMGSNYPIMNLHERVLGVLACKVSRSDRRGFRL